MKNKILLSIVIVLTVLYCFIRSFNNKTSFFINDDNKINIKNTNTNEIQTLNMEDYLIGVLAGEMPASFEIEALKAQAVASRTYAYYKIKNSNNSYDVTNDITTQVHLSDNQMKEKWGSDYEFYLNKIKLAITETKNEVLTYQNEIIPAYYFSMSNGYTENSLTVFGHFEDYLVSVESDEDVNHRNYSVTTSISKNEFCSLLNISCEDIIITNVEKNNTNRVDFITINGKKYAGIDIRKKLNLRSTDFNIA